MKYLFVLLLTALLANNAFAIPMSRALSYVRRNENATILDLIAQYKQYKLQVNQAEDLKAKLLEQAKSKQLAIERKIGNSTSSRGAAKSTSSSAIEPFTVLTATGSAVVFAYHGATSTVSLNLMTTNPPAPASTDHESFRRAVHCSYSNRSCGSFRVSRDHEDSDVKLHGHQSPSTDKTSLHYRARNCLDGYRIRSHSSFSRNNQDHDVERYVNGRFPVDDVRCNEYSEAMMILLHRPSCQCLYDTLQDVELSG